MPTFYASGASDDLCHFYGGGYDEEFGAIAGRKAIALSSQDGGITHIHWHYGDSGVWAVFPCRADADTPMVAGLTFTTSLHDDPDYSMLLEIQSPGPLAITDLDKAVSGEATPDMATVPFPKVDPHKKRWDPPERMDPRRFSEAHRDRDEWHTPKSTSED